MVTPHHLPKKRGVLKKHPKISFLRAPNFLVSHNDFRSKRYNNNRPKRDFTEHTGHSTTQVVNTIFKDPIHQILEKIKVEPSSGQIKWEVIPRSIIKVFIAYIIKTKDTLQKIIELYVTLCNIWSRSRS